MLNYILVFIGGMLLGAIIGIASICLVIVSKDKEDEDVN